MRGVPDGLRQYLAVSVNNLAEKEIGLAFATSAGKRPNPSFWMASLQVKGLSTGARQKSFRLLCLCFFFFFMDKLGISNANQTSTCLDPHQN